MLTSSAYVECLPSKQGRRHPTDVCEPINLAASALPDLEYEMQFDHPSLSSLQIETICRIMQSFSRRSSFLLGDATGVGKGRTIAGLIGEVMRVFATPKIVWVTANARLENDAAKEMTNCEIKDAHTSVLLRTYGAFLSAPRIEELLNWISGSDFPLLVLDECHALKNASGLTARGYTDFVRRAEEKNIRLLYSSATAFSCPKHMQYIGRIGLFGSSKSTFPSFDVLSKALRRHGSPLMELMAIDLKSRGAYLARQLSFSSIQVEQRRVSLTSKQTEVYDACASETAHLRGMQHQQFFQRLITAFKAEEAIRIAEDALRDGYSAVISIVNTCESIRTDDEGAEVSYPNIGASLEEAGVVLPTLPMCALDRIVSHFGEGRVSELTGRRSRIVTASSGRLVRKKPPSMQDEVESFQRGKKKVAVLSRAGGVGISLNDAVDGRRRVHIVLEMPWSAEDFLQQLGRTHRANSLHPPNYVLLTTDIPSELRFASAMLSKLQCFGALVKGDRTSCNVRLFRVPRWGIAERRSIDIYCAAAAALNVLPAGTCIPHMSKKDALRLLRVDGTLHASHIKSRAIRVLQLPEEEGGAPVELLLAAAKALFPADLTMLMHKWTPDIHSNFPDTFKKQVMTFFLCAQAWETTRTLGLLTKDLLFHIVDMMACPVTKQRAADVSSALAKGGLHELSTKSMDAILNRMLGMTIGVQMDIFAVADAVVMPGKPPPDSCLLRYAKERAGAGVDAEVADVRHVSFGPETSGVNVTLRYRVQETKEPPLDAEFWKHSSSSRVCWVDDKTRHLVSSDLMFFRISEWDASALRSKGYETCERKDWLSATTKCTRAAKRRIRKLETEFRIATTNAMLLWSESAQKVLRIPPTSSFPQGRVGLLL